ncbi:MAG: PAS domain S-box protein [Bacteroidetes bacterium]|nr:PAS domain S-box protein [Bacteroidota bacterium]
MKAALSIYSPEVAEQILQNSQKSITFIQSDSRVSYTNVITQKLFGFAPNELIGKSQEEAFLLFSKQPQLFSEAINKREDQIEEMQLARKDGSFFWGQVQLMYVFDAKKNPGGILLIVTDLNKRMAFRESLTQKISTLEQLTKSRFIRDGKLSEAIYEILEHSAKSVKVERVNAWLIDENFTCIESIGNFNSTTQSLLPKETLMRQDLPAYFKLLESEEIIVLNDTFQDKRSKELVENNLTTNHIVSMMDIPIRIEGKMIGVLCFEHTGKTIHEWDLVEQKFGLFVAQLISLAIETHTKQHIKQELEISLREKETLLSEIHHRVKNNLTIISSLINLQAAKAKDEFHAQLFTESKNMVHTIAEIHQLLYESQNFSHINFKEYLNKIIDLISMSQENREDAVKLIKKFDDVYLDMAKAIPCGLIVNELVTNSYKHAFKNTKDAQISVSIQQKADYVQLTISDNGVGMASFIPNENSLGIAIVQDLAKQIGAQISYSNKGGSTLQITFPNPEA